MSGRALLIVLHFLVSALAGGCREGEANEAGGALPVPPPVAGSDGCFAGALALGPGVAPEEVALSVLAIGPATQIAGARDEELLYATGSDGAVVEIDLTGAAPVETELASGVELGELLAAAGVALPAEPSGLAVLDGTSLVVMEHASNALLLVSRDTGAGQPASFLAGFPSAVPGFADGLADLARFSFAEPGEVAPAGDGSIYVADTGNHRVRVVASGGGAALLVATVAGSGAPGFAGGDLGQALFDTPSGLTIACDGRLVVSELGAAGLGGHRVRALTLGVPLPFGGIPGTAETLAGDGTPASGEGEGVEATVAAPSGPVATADGVLYWIDAATGVLRRLDLATGAADCPLAPDCDAAVAAPLATPASAGSLAIGASGALYVLDPVGGRLLRFVP